MLTTQQVITYAPEEEVVVVVVLLVVALMFSKGRSGRSQLTFDLLSGHSAILADHWST